MSLDDYDFTALAVDTSVFISNKFDFSAKKLGLLRKYHDSDVQVLVPQILYYEMLKHFEKRCREEKTDATKGLNSLQFFWKILDDTGKMRDVLKNPNFAKDQLMDFIAEIGGQIILSSGIDLDKIVGLYAGATPPFGEGANKREEFPDAIALLSLEKWAEENQTMVLFVTEDKGAQTYCINSEFVKATPDLASAYQYFLRDDNLFAQHLCENVAALGLQESITTWLTDYIEGQMPLGYADSRFYFEQTDGYAELLSFTLDQGKGCIKILDLSEGEVIIEASGTVEYKATATFDLYLYDSIDRDNVDMGSAEVSSIESEYIEAVITFSKDTMNVLDDLEVEDIEFSPLREVYFGEIEPDWMTNPEPKDV